MESFTEECSGLAHNSETDIVVAVAGVVVVAVRGTAIPRIVDPRTAAFGCLPLIKDTGDGRAGEVNWLKFLSWADKPITGECV